MKTLIIILIGITLYSCGSDNPVTNNSPNNPSDTVLLYSKDSIYTGSPYQGRDSVEYFCTATVDTLHIEFNLYSQNVLNVNVALTAVNTFDTVIALNLLTNQDYHFKLPVNSSNFNSKVFLALMGATGSSYYASLRNIRLWYCP